MSANQTAHFQVEPSLFRLFRTCVTLMFVLMTLGLPDWQADPVPDYDIVLFWGVSALACILLYAQRIWPRFLGQALLPFSLLLITSGIIAGDVLTLWLKANLHAVNELTGADSGRLIVWLLPPLFVVSTQYGAWAWIIFTGVGAYLPWVLALGVALPQPMVAQQFEAVWIRLILFGITGFLSVWVAREQRTYRQQLANKNRQLVAYASTLEQLAVARERNRLARELHDTLAHTLSAINIQLSALSVFLQADPTEAEQRLLRIQAITRDGIHETRRALHDLRAQAVEELGLCLALQGLIQQAKARCDTDFRAQLPPDGELYDLPQHVEQQIFRIAEEAVNNVIRHANASLTELELTIGPLMINMIVRDNGVGFLPQQVAQGDSVGIIGMHERAALMGGKLDIVSHLGNGTQLILMVPLANDSQA